MKDSSSASGSFVDSFASLPDLDVLLHGPALAKSSSAAESTLPVKPLREFVGGVHHLRAPGSSIEGFLSALPSVSAPRGRQAGALRAGHGVHAAGRWDPAAAGSLRGCWGLRA